MIHLKCQELFIASFDKFFCLINFSQTEFLTAFFDTTIRQNTTQFFDKNFRQQISTVNFDIIFRQNFLSENVVEIYCRRSLSKNIVEVNYLTSKNLQHFSTKKLQKMTVFFAKTIQISTNLYRFLQNFTNFFRQKLR